MCVSNKPRRKQWQTFSHQVTKSVCLFTQRWYHLVPYNYWGGFFFLNAVISKLTIPSSLKGKLNDTTYMYRYMMKEMVWHLALFHSSTKLLVLLLNPGWAHLLPPMPHHAFLSLVASGDFHVPLFHLLLIDSSCALQIIFAWWASDSDVWWTWSNLLWNQINISSTFIFLYLQWFHIQILAQI